MTEHKTFLRDNIHIYIDVGVFICAFTTALDRLRLSLVGAVLH